MYTNDFTWRMINDWTDLGLEHHKDVAALIETERVLNAYVHQPSQTFPSLTDPKTVIASVEARAEHNVLRSGLDSPIAQAISSARSAIEYQGIAAARANLDHYTSQLTTRFDDAAARYRNSVVLLPASFAADDLAQFSAEEFAGYRDAAEAAAEIRQARDFLQSLTVITSTANREGFSPVFLVVDPGTPEVYAGVQFAAPASSDRVYESVDPVMAMAVRAGAELRIATPAERNAACREYEAELAEAQAKATERVRSSLIR